MGGGHAGQDPERAYISDYNRHAVTFVVLFKEGLSLFQIVDGESEMPGTYHKMEEGEGGGRRHKHRHHSHHKHRHSERERSEARHGGHQPQQSHHQPSTDTSLEIASNVRHGGGYEDSLYNPKDSLYGPGHNDSLYSGEDNSGGQQHNSSGGGGRGHGSGSDTRLTSPGRYSDGGRHHSDRERHGENTFDHVSKGGHHGGQRRSQEERIWQDPVSRGAESGQIRAPTDIQNIYLPSTGEAGQATQRSHRRPEQATSHIRGWIEPGRPGSGLAAAAALVRGDTYTPEKIKVKVPPPVPVKPGKPGYNKMGMDELWPGGWEEYSEYNITYLLSFGQTQATRLTV